MKLEKVIYDFAEEKNLSIGIASVEPFYELRPILEKKSDSLLGFVEKNIERRIDPRLTMEDVESIIVVAMGYKKNITGDVFGLRGNLSMGAVGTDYHVVLKEHLESLNQRLEEIDPQFQGICFVDTGPLVDRDLAVRGGLGYIGMNGCLHTKKFGSMVFLGYIMTNVVLQKKAPTQGTCSKCKKCIQACPGGALQENGFDIERCVSYLTQKKGLLSREEMRLIGKQIYGCDVCQIVCPNNQQKKSLETFSTEEAMPLLESILSINNKEFRETFGKTAAGWRGKKIIQRNAVAILGNIYTKESFLLLKKVLQDERPLIRHTAVRSILNLGFPDGISLLKEAEKKEQEKEILQEIQDGILLLSKKEGEHNGLLEF